MADGNKILISFEGYKKVEDEYQNLTVNRRKEVAQKIREAREQGDLSENAEYDAARDEQRELERRIAELDNIIKNAEIIQEDSTNKETVGFGCYVKFLAMDNQDDDPSVCQITGSTEANILLGKSSNESPLGSKLLGAKAGQIVNVETPEGTKSYKVLEFWREEAESTDSKE